MEARAHRKPHCVRFVEGIPLLAVSKGKPRSKLLFIYFGRGVP